MASKSTTRRVLELGRIIARLTDEKIALQKALKPFADAVYNDNGDMTISSVIDREAYIRAHFAMRRANGQ